ncbi:Hypothetical protein CINCED_3A005056 [Cinara cedri]|uniref:Uncharacterized protein n=1 Tax=Cinara cedri TaxID=506608 RepID=A0A5E4MB31_9HEMI|nr:Hypothetical protein CINCED_3A005056 [Cinara cedri]
MDPMLILERSSTIVENDTTVSGKKRQLSPSLADQTYSKKLKASPSKYDGKESRLVVSPLHSQTHASYCPVLPL